MGSDQCAAPPRRDQRLAVPIAWTLPTTANLTTAHREADGARPLLRGMLPRGRPRPSDLVACAAPARVEQGMDTESEETTVARPETDSTVHLSAMYHRLLHLRHHLCSASAVLVRLASESH